MYSLGYQVCLKILLLRWYNVVKFDNQRVLMLTHKYASLFLFLEGFASIAIQFLILRQLTPFVGSSVIIVSIVISVFLAALAMGYHRGGSITTNHTEILANNLLYAATILGLFASYFFISILYHYINFLNPIMLLVIYLVAIMAPMVYFVAQTIPILVNSMKAKTSAKQAGDALLYSTLGNVFGGIITTVIIMYFVGTSWAIMLTVTILLVLSLTITSDRKKAMLKILILLPLVFFINIIYTKKIFVAETAYANYSVETINDNKHFIINRSNSSFIDNKTKKVYPYIENIQKMIKLYAFDIPNPQILILGAGGFTLNFHKDLPGTFHYVDIDQRIKTIAEKHFLKEDINATFTGKDARLFLNESTSKYDIIIVDAYTNAYAIPENLSTVEFYRLISHKLKPRGLLISNVIADPFLSDSFSKLMDNTIRAPFTSCFTNVIDSIGGNANILYICSIRPVDKEEETTLIYHDNTNRVSIDYFLDRVSFQSNRE